MDNIPVKLAAPAVPEFNYFVDNQVLTAAQLNTVTDHLERQHRLTRNKLVGAGIVCGLEVGINIQGAVTVTKGTALTSDGDLFCLEQDQTYAFVRAFSDSRAIYAPWRSGTTVLPMLELLSTAPAQTDLPVQPIGTVNGLTKMVVVLYLESYLRPPEDCTDTDCDNLGPKQINQLKVLLLNEGDLTANGLVDRQNLPPIPTAPIRRVVMSGTAITGTNNLGNRFEKAIKDSSGPLRNALEFTVKHYAHFTRIPTFGSDWIILSDRISGIMDIENGVQFAYAAMKDIAYGLKELNEAAATQKSRCVIAPTLFPKHIIAGGVIAANAALRHGFIEAAQLNNGTQISEKITAYLFRIDAMLRGFRVPRPAAGIRIFPSKTGGLLGDKAIPQYYQIIDSSPLNQYWHFEKQRSGNADTIRGYHVPVDPNDAVGQEPLAYVHEDCNFYRIDGLHGLEKDEALKLLTELRNRYNLPFRVEGVQIENDITRFVLPPRIKLPFWEGVWHQQRESLFDRLQLAKDYASKMHQPDIDSSVANDSEVRAKVTNAKSMATTMRGKIDEASSAVYVSAKSFAQNYQMFRQPYTDAVKMGYEINNNVQQFSQTATESPLHHFAVFNHAFQLDRLMDIANKKTDLVKRQFIFDNFQNQHPGLEHLGGVPVGGTFVVVHQNDRVVADFALPYAVEFDLDPDVDITPPTVADTKPPIHLIDPNNFKWLDKYHYFKDIGITKAVEPLDFKVRDLGIRFDKDTLTNDGFIKNWLPVLNLGKQGGLTNPGLTGSFTKPSTQAKAESLTKKKDLISYYETKGIRSNQEEVTYQSLLKDYDQEASEVMKSIAEMPTDISVGSDEAQLLDMVSVHVGSMSTNSVEVLSSMSTVHSGAGSISNNIIKGGIIKIFR